MKINGNYTKDELILLYQKFFAAMPVGITIYDETGQCYFSNRKTAELIGANSVDDVLKQNYHHIDSWKNSGLYDLALKAIRTCKTYRFVNNIHTTFGKDVWLDILLNPVIVANNKHLLLIVSDITEIKKTEIEYKNLSITDSLTGIYNRRCFDEKFADEIYRASRSKSPLSLILIDIDYFKLYNDYYGHLAGDMCLISIAQCIKNTLKRKTDCVARYGGEEFVCILPYTDLNGAIKTANNIKDEIQALKIPHEKSSVSNFVTVSQGIYTVNSSNVLDVNTCIENVDKAMYLAKKNGRNRIEVYNLNFIF